MPLWLASGPRIRHLEAAHSSFSHTGYAPSREGVSNESCSLWTEISLVGKQSKCWTGEINTQLVILGRGGSTGCKLHVLGKSHGDWPATSALEQGVRVGEPSVHMTSPHSQVMHEAAFRPGGWCLPLQARLDPARSSQKPSPTESLGWYITCSELWSFLPR